MERAGRRVNACPSNAHAIASGVGYPRTACMPAFEPRTPDYAARVRASFDAQPLMRTLGAMLTAVEPGVVHIELPFSTALTQQHGYVHAGAITSIVDSACGYAAYSLM